MLLKSLISISALALACTGRVLEERRGRYDTIHNGQYTIVNCGVQNRGRLVKLVTDIRTVLRPSLRDVWLPNPGPAFRTFLGQETNAPYVQHLLANVTAGVSLYPPNEGFHQTGSPVLICPTAEGQVVGSGTGTDYYYQCILDPLKPLIPIRGTPYIAICSQFFATSSGSPYDMPPADHDCLPVTKSNNRFLGTGLDMTNFRVWTLLAGILEYYIYATTRFAGSLATDVNSCTRLGPKQMLVNPSNYIYYVASVYSHCQDFPNLPSVPRRRPLENATLPSSSSPTTNDNNDDKGNSPNATMSAGGGSMNGSSSSPLVMVEPSSVSVSD